MGPDKASAHRTAPNPGWFAPTEDENNESSPVRTAANEDPSRRTDAPPASHDDWVHLRPGPKRIDELADFVEWIANARPEDEQAIRAEIKRYFCDVGDQASCNALNAHLTALLKPGRTREDRQRILNSMDAFTRVDPAEFVHVRDWATAVAVTIGGVPSVQQPRLRPRSAPVPRRGRPARKRRRPQRYGNSAGAGEGMKYTNGSATAR